MLATIAQVEAILGRTLDAAEQTRATQLIGMVQAAIEDHLGRPAEGATYTDELYTAGLAQTAVLLRHWPIASIASITEDGTALTVTTDYLAELPSGIIQRVSGGVPIYWHPGGETIAVTYDSATIAGLSTLCAQIVARTMSASDVAAAAPSVMAGLRQLTIGRWSGTRESGAGADPVGALVLTEADEAKVDAWRDRKTH